MRIFLTDKQKRDYQLLSSLRSKYISMIKDFLKENKVKVFQSLPNVYDLESLLDSYYAIIDKYNRKLENVEFLLNEFDAFYKQLKTLFIEDIEALLESSQIDEWLILLVIMEFEYYLSGIKSGMSVTGV